MRQARHHRHEDGLHRSTGRPASFDDAWRGRAHAVPTCFAWLRLCENENFYAHPIEGLNAVIDLKTGEVIRVDDYGVIPIPMPEANYEARVSDEPPRAPLPINHRSSSRKASTSSSMASNDRAGTSGRSSLASTPREVSHSARHPVRRPPVRPSSLARRDAWCLMAPRQRTLPQACVRHRRVRHRQARPIP